MTTDFAYALGAPGQPQMGFQAVEAAIAAIVHHRLFTIMRHEWSFNRRVYTNMPDVYPLGGLKPVRDIAWMQRVRADLPAISNGPAEIQSGFTDNATLLGLGLTNALNLPVFWDGKLVGVVNVLRSDAPFCQADADACRPLAAYTIPGLLA